MKPTYYEVTCEAVHGLWYQVDEAGYDEYLAAGWKGRKLYTSDQQLDAMKHYTDGGFDRLENPLERLKAFCSFAMSDKNMAAATKLFDDVEVYPHAIGEVEKASDGYPWKRITYCSEQDLAHMRIGTKLYCFNKDY